MFIFKKYENKKSKYTQKDVLDLLDETGYLSTAMIQHKFTVGYADAAKMIDTLAESGYIKHDGQRWVKIWYPLLKKYKKHVIIIP